MRLMIASSLVLVCSAVASGAAVAQQYGYESYPGNDSGIVRCESVNGRTQQCPADTYGGVRLVRQLSRGACVQGQNWGYGRNGIWVSGGCRGEFALGYGGRDGGYGYGDRYGDAGPQVIRCESNDGRSRGCPIDARGGVRLIRQLSRSPCIEGQTWGRDRHGLWVSQGCRAEFEIGYRRDRGYGWGRNDNRYDDGYGGPQTIRCESSDGRGHRCNVRMGRGAQLVRQLSRSACVEGQSWGWDRQGIWVDRGCRGEFNVW